MRPQRRRSKLTWKQILIYIIIVVGSLLLLGLLFWLFKPFGKYDGPIYGYHYVYY